MMQILQNGTMRASLGKCYKIKVSSTDLLLMVYILLSDAMSVENATILTNSIKWPLMIDPQLQGVKWIKNKYGASLHIIRLNQKNYLDVVEKCVSH